MDKITIGNEDYGVLTTYPESIQHATHARLAGGKVVDLIYSYTLQAKICNYPGKITLEQFEDLGIQPLKLLEKVPVEFTGRITQSWVSGDYATVTLSVSLNQFEDFPIDLYDGYKLTCSVLQVVD